MKLICFGFFLLCTLTCLHCQITITNATFPSAGDSLKTAIDAAPVNIVMGSPGGPYNWDLASLQASTRQVTVYQPASAGTASGSFPNAELVTIGVGGFETYFNVAATTFDNLGYFGDDPTGLLPIPGKFVFMPQLPERHAPLSLFSIFQNAADVSLAISLADIPAGILDSLGIPTGLLDSVRVRLSISRTEIADAFGTMRIPGGTYDVLRDKRIDYRQTNIDAHVPFLGWVAISTIIPGISIPPDTLTTFNFYNNSTKEPIAVVTTDNNTFEAQQIEYKDNGIENAVNTISNENEDVSISPNPANSSVNFDLHKMKPGKYSFRLLAANGQIVKTQSLENVHETISIEALDPGIYFYLIFDSKNRIVRTGKIVKNN